MKVLRVYLRIYGECFRKAFTAIGRNAWTLLLPAVLLWGWDKILMLVAPLGLVGGILAALARAALASSYLYFVGELVQSGRVSLSELQKSVGAYFWSLVNLFFVFWIASFLIGAVAGPNASALLLALSLVAVVALNAAPEVIYLRGTYGGLQTIHSSFDFLKQEWIPWFAANIPLLAGVYSIGYFVRVEYVTELLMGAALHVAMVFRGHLFKALVGSSHRQRMFYQRVA